MTAPSGKKPIFEKGKRYPHDGVSEYVDLDGEVTYVDPEPLSDCTQVKVRTRDHGELTAFTYEGAPSPPLGAIATVRCYAIGGGWYPDDRIIGWRTAKQHYDE